MWLTVLYDIYYTLILHASTFVLIIEKCVHLFQVFVCHASGMQISIGVFFTRGYFLLRMRTNAMSLHAVGGASSQEWQGSIGLL